MSSNPDGYPLEITKQRRWRTDREWIVMEMESINCYL
jgi:hypothetical protein